MDWLEVLSENFLGVGGAQRAMLERIRGDTPLALHGVSLSIAGSEPLSTHYLAGLRALAEFIDPVFVSDHLAWTALRGHETHDLLPVAFTREVLDHVAARVAHVQETLGRPLLLENATVYVAFRANEMTEAQFLSELCERTGCGLLLDVNNVFVCASNHGFHGADYLRQVPWENVVYFHTVSEAVAQRHSQGDARDYIG